MTLLHGQNSEADVLPDDRADLQWHSFDGGGITVDGPAVQVRKKIGDSWSVDGDFYVDTISSASIDVVTQASPMCKRACYTEERRQGTLSADYQRGKTTYSFGMINSTEPDFKSNTAFFSVSQSMFGDLTTINFGATRGWDKVGERNHATEVTTWLGDADRRNWQIGASQVLTRNMLLAFNFETTESDGLLNNPYRAVRYVDPTRPLGYAWEPEVDPDTRSGNAGSLRLKYFLPWRAAADLSYRYYTDTWHVRGSTITMGYSQPIGANVTVDASARFYQQTHASFYTDLLPYFDSQNFLSRDRELAQFHSLTLGLGGSWQFHPLWPHWIEKGTLNFSVDKLRINYADFRNLLAFDPTVAAGTEPLYTLNATIWQAFISLWY